MPTEAKTANNPRINGAKSTRILVFVFHPDQRNISTTPIGVKNNKVKIVTIVRVLGDGPPEDVVEGARGTVAIEALGGTNVEEEASEGVEIFSGVGFTLLVNGLPQRVQNLLPIGFCVLHFGHSIIFMNKAPLFEIMDKDLKLRLEKG